jgi:hypothetical protein
MGDSIIHCECGGYYSSNMKNHGRHCRSLKHEIYMKEAEDPKYVYEDIRSLRCIIRDYHSDEEIRPSKNHKDECVQKLYNYMR